MEYALYCGMSHKEYWSATIREVKEVIKVHNKKTTNEMKERASLVYANAMLNRTAIADVLGGKNKFPKIWEVYPNLFEKPQQTQDWKLAKANFMRFAEAHNKKRGENK